jgi:hypothetical protein
MVPEDKLNEFVTRLRTAGGANVEAVILFGSAVTGDFHPEFSDLNLFCVLADTSFAPLQALTPAVQWWGKQKQPPPLCMTRQELERSTDVFTIELLDMVEHHRVLYGNDVLAGLQISTRLHRNQVEYELREKLSLLRRHLLVAGSNDSRLWEILLHSAPSFATLFRHTLIVLGNASAPPRREAVRVLSKRIDFDLSPVEQALDARHDKAAAKKIDVKDLCGRYLAAVEKVTATVDMAFDSAPGSD